MMQLHDFLTAYPTGFHNAPVTVFSAADEHAIPLIFASLLIKDLKEKGTSVTSLDVSKDSLGHISAHIETSFLGNECMYWLRGFQEIDKKSREQLYEYLSTYHGPHRLIIFDTEANLSKFFSKQLVVKIPSTITREIVLLLIRTVIQDERSAHSLQLLCQSYQKVSLDQACMMHMYSAVLSKHEDAAKHLEQILEPEQSLFMVSQYFFAKQSTQFFGCWERIEKTYPATFWTVFWSEQLWRAYHVRYFLDFGQPQHAKSMGFRLPFTYLQRDWKKTTRSELRTAHQWIYQLDLNLKNSHEIEAGFILFYTKFFLNEFC